jgi:hypothetical protein
MDLYTVDYWIPFPASEYGGLYIIAAENVDQVVEVCRGATNEWDIEDYEHVMESRIRERCTIIGTTDLFEEPCVVNSFWT